MILNESWWDTVDYIATTLAGFKIKSRVCKKFYSQA